jgi:hypothetical protein
MKSHIHIVIIATLALTGCASGSGAQTSKSSATEYIRDVNGTTQYRIRDGNVLNTNGARVARIDSSGNIFNTNGARVGTISKK